MPRQYMQPQPGLFVGQSARQDMAQGRARADQERVRQQRLQGFQYTGQARQAGRTQREAQRAAQQQMAMASQERDADRQFQMQRDAFGARRDYSMQERRIQSAAEQAQFGRDFEREQQDTRFGQQQDLAMQEQDYRLQQLDIAAQDQFLSAEQLAEIRREQAILVNEMNSDAAREARAEQFGYGQMGADTAADRSSVAAREQAGISDWLSDRQQGRAARYQEDAQGRAADIRTQEIRLSDKLGRGATTARIDRETEAREYLGGLSALDAQNVLSQTHDNNIDMSSVEHQRLLRRAAENANIIEQKNIAAKQREREEKELEARQVEEANALRPLYANPDNHGGFGSPEFRAAEREAIEKAWQKPLPLIMGGPSVNDDWERNTIVNDKGTFQRGGPGQPFIPLAPPVRKHFTPEGEEVGEGVPFQHGNQIFMYPPGSDKPVSFGDTPGSRLESLYAQQVLQDAYATRKVKQPGLGGETTEYVHPVGERNKMLRDAGFKIPESKRETHDKKLQDIKQGLGPQMSASDAAWTIEYLNNIYGRGGRDSVDPTDWEEKDVYDWHRAQKVLGGLSPAKRKDLKIEGW